MDLTIPAGTPSNLKELMEAGTPGYQLEVVHFLELDHTLMGRFPALYRGTKNVVLVVDLELLKQAWKTLTPRKAKVGTVNYYVNPVQKIGFPVLDDPYASKAQPILTKERFNELVAADPHPFEWAPGLISNEMDEEEFNRTLEAAMQKRGLQPA